MNAFFGARARLFLASGDDHDDLRFRRLVTRFHRLGPRVLAEFLDELGCERTIRFPIEQKLDRYVERLDPEVLKAVGADRLPPAPIHRINFTRGDDDQ